MRLFSQCLSTKSFRAGKARNRIGASAQMAEFAPALMVFILAVLFPMINLLSFSTGYASVAMLGQNCAVQAASAATYAQALTEMRNAATNMTNSGIGRFAKLQPVGGSNGTGVDLFITETDLNSKAVTKYGPNTGVTGTPDNTNKIYEFSVRTNFNIGPFLNLGSLPFVGGIPLVGQPVLITTLSHRAVEHQEALK
ncbi:MAG: hypothetical protein K2Y32_17455 [Candidatus Obscuribacterales bacterium]|nr:hypothetical protein [Candidatus Obscuribacterales bacterium]